MTTEQAFEAIEEISVQATIDSPYVVSITLLFTSTKSLLTMIKI